MIRKLTVFCALVLCMPAFAQDISIERMLGEWTFTAYAEKSAPDQRTPVNAVFEFLTNGVLITKMRDRETESTWSLDGNTFRYSDANGEQVWTVRDFVPGVSIVMENSSTLMFLERR